MMRPYLEKIFVDYHWRTFVMPWLGLVQYERQTWNVTRIVFPDGGVLETRSPC